MGDLSPHFSKSEFTCHDGSYKPVDPRLIGCLEKLRSICGNSSLEIVSGYRSPGYNKKIGGASHSQHIYGRAADIVAGYCTVSQAIRAGFKGIGRNRQGKVIHVDVRPGNLVIFNDY